MTNVLEINDVKELSSYHLAWTALHAETPGASFFNTLEWLQTYWAHFGEGQRLRVLIVRHEGRPLGIVPLCERTETTRLGKVRVLTYPLDDWGIWYSPIGACQTAIQTLAMKHIASTPREWDIFEPRWTDTGTDRGRLELAMKLAELPAEIAPHRETSLIECDQFPDWNAYLASRKTKTRHEIERKRRKIQRSHNMEYVTYRPEALRDGGGDPRWDLYEECLAVSRKSWQAESQTGNTLCQAHVSAFLADAHEQAARLGMLDLHLLRVEGVAVAYSYGYHCRGQAMGLRMGFDPAAPKGVGSVLLGHLIQNSFEQGDLCLDMGVGTEGFKKNLRTSTKICTHLTHNNARAWRPRAMAAARWARKQVGSVATMLTLA